MLNPIQPFAWLLVYVVLLYIRPHEYLTSLLEVAVLPISLGVAAALWLFRTPKRFDAPQFGLMLGLCIAIGLSWFANGWFGGSLQAMTDFLPVLVLFFLVATTVDSLKRLRQLYFVVTACMVVLSFHGIDQLAKGGVGWTGAQTIEGRITYLGFLNDPNDLAMALVMSLPMSAYLARTAGNFLMRWLYYAATALLAYATYLCNSRGSFIALCAMAFVYSLQRFGPGTSTITFPLLLLPIVLLAPSRIREISGDEESAAGRVEAWYEGLQMFFSHPLFGVGQGGYTEHYSMTAHNSYLLALAELGLVGYFFWLTIFGASLWMMRVITKSKSPPVASDEPRAGAWPVHQLAAWSVVYGSTGVLVSALFLSRSYIVLLYVQAAIAVAVFQTTRSRWPELAPLRLGTIAPTMVMFTLGSVVFFWVATRVLL